MAEIRFGSRAGKRIVQKLFILFPVKSAGTYRRLNTSHRTRREMEMIQLMGTPSVDRQSQASLGNQSSAEMLDGGVDNEFTSHLDTAILDGQKKEVNPDELIAQLVGLDLISGSLPIQRVSGGADLGIDLSVGQIDLESSHTTNTEQSGLLSDSLGDSIYGSRTSNGVSTGQAVVDNRNGFSTGGDCMVDPNFGDLPKGIASGLSADVSLTSREVADQSSDLDIAIKDGVRDWMVKQTNGNRDSQVNLTAGLVSADAEVPTVDVSGLGLSRFDVAKPVTIRKGARESAKEIPIDSAPAEEATNASTATTQANDVAQIVSVLANGVAASERNSEIRTMPSGSEQSAAPGKVGYNGTGQGRPNDRLHFGLTIPSGTTPKPVSGVNDLTAIEPPVIAPTSVVPAPIDPRELSKLSPTKFESVETASAIIEGIAGRLTRESFAVKPTVVAVPQVQTGETATTVTQAVVQPVVTQEFAQSLKVVSDDRTGAEPTVKAVDAEKGSIGAAEQMFVEPKSTERISENQFNVPLDDSDLKESKDSDGGGVDSVDSMPQADLSKSVSKSSETKAKGEVKPEVETALQTARNEIAQAVMDLVAARRPQSIRVQLTPHDLGVIDVSVKTGGGRVDVDLRASDEGVRHGLASNRADLVRTIESGGTSVSSMNVGQHLGQDAGQAGHRGSDQASREDFQQAVNLGQVSTNAETLAVGSSSYGTSGNGRVDLAA
jgi:hypothetical protein